MADKKNSKDAAKDYAEMQIVNGEHYMDVIDDVWEMGFRYGQESAEE